MSEEQKPEQILETINDIINGNKRHISVAGHKVIIDPSRLQFNDAGLQKFSQEEAVWYDYFGSRFADAEAELQYYELKHEALYSSTFVAFKDAGSTDKMSEAKTKADPEVIKAAQIVVKARFKVKVIQQHLRAWDKAHENSNNRGHMIRKEIDKFTRDITSAGDDGMSPLEGKIDDIIKAAQ